MISIPRTRGGDPNRATSTIKYLNYLAEHNTEEDGEKLPAPSRMDDVELRPNERAVPVEAFMPGSLHAACSD